MERLASLFSHYQILFEISEEYIKHNNSARAMGKTIEFKYRKKHAFCLEKASRHNYKTVSIKVLNHILLRSCI